MSSAVTPQQVHQQNNRVPAASQATHIEQARAIAEVQAMFMVAKQAPRDEGRATAKAMEACSHKELAERAFYSFPRGGETVNGPSIGLATELARCWGNIDYGIMELSRDDVLAQTEMLAFARDLETNTRSHQTFIVPHARDTRSGRKALVDMRDIYENNANNGARRLRECIFRVLPVSLRIAAENRCRQVLENGDGSTPIAQRVAEAIQAFSKIGISLDRLEAKMGATSTWTPVEIANLEISYRSIKRAETTADEAFPKVAEDINSEVKRAVEGKKAKAGAKAQPETDAKDQAQPAEKGESEGKAPQSIPEWMDEETRLIGEINLAVSEVDRAALEEAEKRFLGIKSMFPENVAQKLQSEIDEGFTTLLEKD